MVHFTGALYDRYHARFEYVPLSLPFPSASLVFLTSSHCIRTTWSWQFLKALIAHRTRSTGSGSFVFNQFETTSSRLLLLWFDWGRLGLGKFTLIFKVLRVYLFVVDGYFLLGAFRYQLALSVCERTALEVLVLRSSQEPLGR